MVQLIDPPTTGPRPCAAQLLGAAQRRDLAVQVLSGQESIRQAARDHEVSRKFVARQTDTARHALDQAFQPPDPPRDDVRFWLPVTPDWLEQAALGLMLICHS